MKKPKVFLENHHRLQALVTSFTSPNELGWTVTQPKLPCWNQHFSLGQALGNTPLVNKVAVSFVFLNSKLNSDRMNPSCPGISKLSASPWSSSTEPFPESKLNKCVEVSQPSPWEQQLPSKVECWQQLELQGCCRSSADTLLLTAAFSKRKFLEALNLFWISWKIQ